MRSGFTIHHNGPPASCIGRAHTRCEQFWAAVRSYHVNTKGWSDIAYSFGVCPHGVRFVGRGWDKSQFANGSDVVGPDDGGDAYWYTVLTFIGTDEAPTPEMVEGVRCLIDEGRSSGRCGTRVLPHNAFKPKPCPGPEFTALAGQWNDAPLTTTPETDMPLNANDINLIAATVREQVLDITRKETIPAIVNGVVSQLPDGDAEAAAAVAQAVIDAIVAELTD